jgi:hypothetical protein
MPIRNFEKLLQSADEISDSLVLLLSCMAKVLAGHDLAHGVQSVSESGCCPLIGLLLSSREKIPLLKSSALQMPR